jgi:hypothetical protein
MTHGITWDEISAIMALQRPCGRCGPAPIGRAIGYKVRDAGNRVARDISDPRRIARRDAGGVLRTACQSDCNFVMVG